MRLSTVLLYLAAASLAVPGICQFADNGDIYGPIGNPTRNQYGTPINQDYFAAAEFSGTRSIVHLVEIGHLNQDTIEQFQQGFYNGVMGDLTYILDHVINHPKALSLMGAVARLTDSPTMPIPYFQKALAMYPQHALTHAQYGTYLVSIDAVEEGLVALKKAVSIDPNLAIAQAWLAEAYYKSGDPVQGREAATRAMELGFTKTIRGYDDPRS